MNLDIKLLAKLKAERARGQSANVWVPKKWGIVEFRPMKAMTFLKRLFDANMAALKAAGAGNKALANAAEGWYVDGQIAMLVTDAPYSFRYSLEQFSTQTQPSGIPYTWPPQKLAMQYPIANGATPLGLCTDEPSAGGSGTLETQPVPVTIQTLGAARKTLIGVTDSVVTFGNFLIPSTTTAGQLKAATGLPAGAYNTVGLSLSTSEGAGAQIEFDPRPGTFFVDVIT